MSVPMYTVLAIKDSTESGIWVEDLGVEITDATNGQSLSDWFSYDSLAGSDSLRQVVEDGDVIINNGIENLSSEAGVKYLTFIQREYLEDNYYSKNELNVGGDSEVHWDNITNVPNITQYWIDPVLYRVDDITDTPPGSPEIGDVYFDTDDSNYYLYVDSTNEWVAQSTAQDGDRVINLANAHEDVYVFDSTGGFIEQAQELDNAAVNVNDDGDGGQAQYIYNSDPAHGSVGWTKMADVDFSGPHRHPANYIDVENAYTNIGNEAGDDLETVLGDIDIALLSQNPDLDAAYDQGGPGVGRKIIVDAGAVILDGTSTYAPLELTPQSSVPSSDLQPGQLSRQTDGILYTYDGTRSKWLSIDRMMLCFGKRGASKNQYLGFYGGQLISNNSGLRMVRTATIVSISVQVDSSGTADFHIRKNDVISNISTLALSAALGAGDTTIDVDLAAGDFLQGFVECTAAVTDPMLLIEIAWRKD